MSFVGAWLCTYLVHSTLLLGGVALLDRIRCVKSTTALEFLWRVAIVGGLMTTTFQVSGKYLQWPGAAGYSLGQWMVGDREATHRLASEAELPSENENSTLVVHSPSKNEFAASKISLHGQDLTYAYAERFALRFTSALAWIWLIGAFMKTSCLVGLGLQARSELKDRTIVDASHLRGLHLPSGASQWPSPIVAVTDRIEGPVALPNGEIVFPQWIFDSLTAEQRQAIYAHELAHQVRRDPIGLLCLHLLNAVLWIQPLHRLARLRLAHLAELQADAWAARGLSNARTLAESLYICAERMISPRKMAFGCSFSAKGPLVERIDCLLEGTAMSEPKRPYWAPLLAASVLALAMFAVPGCNVDSEMAFRSGQSISVTRHDGGKMGEVTIRRANLFVKLTHTGKFQLTADSDEVETLENGGEFKLAESQGNIKRVYTIEADKLGVVTRSYSLNGKEAPIDENVQAWFADALQRTVRESGF